MRNSGNYKGFALCRVMISSNQRHIINDIRLVSTTGEPDQLQRLGGEPQSKRIIMLKITSTVRLFGITASCNSQSLHFCQREPDSSRSAVLCASSISALICFFVIVISFYKIHIDCPVKATKYCHTSYEQYHEQLTHQQSPLQPSRSHLPLHSHNRP